MLELSQLQAGASLKFSVHIRSIWGMIRAQAVGAGALSFSPVLWQALPWSGTWQGPEGLQLSLVLVVLFPLVRTL